MRLERPHVTWSVDPPGKELASITQPSPGGVPHLGSPPLPRLIDPIPHIHLVNSATSYQIETQWLITEL